MSDVETAARVVLCDPDYGVLRALGDALRARGFRVALAVDGRSGLARAVESSPDVVVVDRDVGVVDVRTFVELLRENPRTAGAFVFVTGRGDPRHVAPGDPRLEALPKPLDVDDVARRIEAVVHPPAAPVVASPELAVGSPAPAVARAPSEVRLADLVQIFALRRRTGRIEVRDHLGANELVLLEGRIVAARFAGETGRGAALWALATARGDVRFVTTDPGEVRAAAVLDLDAPLLADEAARLAAALEVLPPELRGPRTVLAPGPLPSPGPLRPAARQLLALLAERAHALGELLERHEGARDALLGALGELVAAGSVLLVPPPPAPERVRLAGDDDVESVGAKLASLQRVWPIGPPRLLVLAGGAGDVAALRAALRAIDGFVDAGAAPVDLGGGAFGPLGELSLAGLPALELFVLPLDATLRPLWSLAAAPAVAAWTLDPVGRGAPADTVGSLRALAGLTPREVREGWHAPARLAALLRETLGALG